MIKKFFISMLGSMAAFWLSLVFLMVIAIAAVGILAGKALAGADTSMTGDRVLHVKLSGSISERAGGESLSTLLADMEDPSDDMESILRSISLASDDDDIKGIFLDCQGSSLGVASRSELIEALKKFKKSGKFIYAYSDNYDQGDYYVASVADSLFLNPVGSINIHGLCSTTMFYKDVLDKVGIDVNVVRVGSYKSAVEPFMRMDMSPESRMQTELFVNSIWQSMTSEIAANRSLADADVVNQWADSIAFTWAPERYIAQNAVTSLRYRSEVDDLLRKKVDVDDDDDVPLQTVADYLLTKTDGADAGKDHIAVYYAAGDIVQDGDGGIVGSQVVPDILRLAKDDHVSGLVLRVNSGGGSAFASEQIWKALEEFKAAGKPFYVSMGDYAASGGYYISCGADRIYADAATLTGSIGIFGIIPNAQRLLQDKIGLGFEDVATGANANFPSLTKAPTSRQLAAMQSYVERGYETFTSRVAEGRSIPLDSVKAIGGGRVWDGLSALEIGLVDEIGSLAQCVKAMADHLDIDASRVISYPHHELSPLETMIKAVKGNVDVNVGGIDARQMQIYADEARKIMNMDPVQARMERMILK